MITTEEKDRRQSKYLQIGVPKRDRSRRGSKQQADGFADGTKLRSVANISKCRKNYAKKT